MKVPDIARSLKRKGARQQCYLLPGAPRGTRLVAHSDQEVSGAGEVVRFAFLALLFLGGWPRGLRQP